jgi:hypothetical protein
MDDNATPCPICRCPSTSGHACSTVPPDDAQGLAEAAGRGVTTGLTKVLADALKAYPFVYERRSLRNLPDFKENTLDSTNVPGRGQRFLQADQTSGLSGYQPSCLEVAERIPYHFSLEHGCYLKAK